MLIVPPGSGIVHQVNLEYLARAVFIENGLLYPDSLVGTDSHTTMINGLGVVGWGNATFCYRSVKFNIDLRIRHLRICSVVKYLNTSVFKYYLNTVSGI